jgi:hypothetical protein
MLRLPAQRNLEAYLLRSRALFDAVFFQNMSGKHQVRYRENYREIQQYKYSNKILWSGHQRLP